MDSSFLSSTEQALDHFKVDEHQGLSAQQVQKATERYGRNGTVYLLSASPLQNSAEALRQLYPKILPHLYGGSY